MDWVVEEQDLLKQDKLVVDDGEKDPFIGKIIGERYRIEKRIGRGGMGLVYQAQHTSVKRTVAIKLLPQTSLAEETAHRRFFREAQLAGSLEHPNVIAVHDYGVTDGADGAPYIVMDYAPGEPLSKIIERDGTLSRSQFVEVFSQVCAGLQHAHEKGLVHRDIKPSNIIVDGIHTDKINVKIVDFGIAHGAGSHTVTQTGEVTGSAAYISPEQCTGNRTDSRADVYSLGCVMFEALTGRQPFNAENVIGTVYQHVHQPAPLVSTASNRIERGDPLELLVEKALQKDPDKRFQSMTEMAAALHSQEPARHGQKRTYTGLIVVACLLMMIPMLMLIFFNKPNSLSHTNSAPQDLSSWPRYSYDGISFAHPPGLTVIESESSKEYKAKIAGSDASGVYYDLRLNDRGLSEAELVYGVEEDLLKNGRNARQLSHQSWTTSRGLEGDRELWVLRDKEGHETTFLFFVFYKAPKARVLAFNTTLPQVQAVELFDKILNSLEK